MPTAGNLAQELKTYARALDLDWIGFCPIAALSDDDPDAALPDSQPNRYLENVQSVISIGYRLNYTSIQNLPASCSAYMLEHDFANQHLDRASQRLTRFLKEHGFNAIGFDAGAEFYHEAGKAPKRFAADFSHKHAAVACGLGPFGVNNLVLSAQWRPRIRLTSLLTNATLESKLSEGKSLCPADGCLDCVRICPVGALDRWKEHYPPRRGWVMDKQACYDHIFTTLKGQRCGLCIKACPVGLAATEADS
jgi:epoxyqueuosine reductase QueG